MNLHESRRSPAHRIDDLQLLQGLLTQRLYVPEHDRRLLRALLANAPRHLRTPVRAPRRGVRRLRATGAALALSGALALTLGSPLLTAVAASPQPATWVAAADHSASPAPSASDALLRALLNRESAPTEAVTATNQVSDVLLRTLLNRAAAPSQVIEAAPSQTVTTSDQASDVLLRALLNHESAPTQAVAIAEQAASPASDVLLRTLLNSATTPIQPVAAADQAALSANDALSQAELAAGETLVIPDAQVAVNAIVADAIAAAPAASYYVVQPGDTLSGIALAYYGNANLWPAIFNANTDKIANPHWIYPNQQLTIPTVGYSTLIYNPPTTIPSNRGLGQYTVKSGDTLSGIAYYAYGNANWWGLYQANAGQICNPDLIYPGQVLTVP